MDFRLNELSHKLWIYLEPFVDQKIAAVNARGSRGGSSGSGGVPNPHALDSSYHHGILGDAQAPQFLKIDGSRDLAGHLTVLPGITIDGVDLSAFKSAYDTHIANVNAHHPRDHSITGSTHTASGLTTGHVIRATGTTTFAWQQLQHGDLGGVSANQHHNQQHSIVGSDHTAAAAKWNLIGLTATNVIGYILPSSDVGTAPAEKVLKSDASGQLTLKNLYVKGKIEVDGDDLEVKASSGASPLMLVDRSLHSVKIGVPTELLGDSQFLLDVGGPIRGTEIVGKHAIQLNDVVALMPFDGPYPYKNNFTGSVVTHMGRSPAVNGDPYFLPGKFYKALVLHPGTTNLLKNPSFETNLTNWYQFAAGGTITLTRDNTDSYIGDYALKAAYTAVGVSPQVYYDAVTVTPGSTYTASWWVRADREITATFDVLEHNAPYTVHGSKTINLTTEWQQFTLTVTVGAGSAGRVRQRLYLSGGLATYWIDGAQFEEGGGTPYIDGSVIGEYPQNAGNTWTGTAHASTSTRSNVPDLAWSLDNAPVDWTLMGWIKLGFDIQTAAQHNHVSLSLTNGYAILGSNKASGQALRFQLYDSVVGNTNYPTLVTQADHLPENWYHFALTYKKSTGTATYFLNGVQLGSNTRSNWGTVISLRVGEQYGYPGNGLLDDLVVVGKALSADRIRAIYESDARVFAETTVFSFRATPKGLVWANDEGLWVRNTDGDDIFGIYGGEAASKSWGGLSLTQGDILMGNNTDGYLFWDNDAVSNKLSIKNASIKLYDGASNLRLYMDPEKGLLLWADNTAVPGTMSNPRRIQWFTDVATPSDLIGEIYSYDVGNYHGLILYGTQPNSSHGVDAHLAANHTGHGKSAGFIASVDLSGNNAASLYSDVSLTLAGYYMSCSAYNFNLESNGDLTLGNDLLIGNDLSVYGHAYIPYGNINLRGSGYLVSNYNGTKSVVGSRSDNPVTVSAINTWTEIANYGARGAVVIVHGSGGNKWFTDIVAFHAYGNATLIGGASQDTSATRSYRAYGALSALLINISADAPWTVQTYLVSRFNLD